MKRHCYPAFCVSSGLRTGTGRKHLSKKQTCYPTQVSDLSPKGQRTSPLFPKDGPHPAGSLTISVCVYITPVLLTSWHKYGILNWRDRETRFRLVCRRRYARKLDRAHLLQSPAGNLCTIEHCNLLGYLFLLHPQPTQT